MIKLNFIQTSASAITYVRKYFHELTPDHFLVTLAGAKWRLLKVLFFPFIENRFFPSLYILIMATPPHTTPSSYHVLFLLDSLPLSISN